MNAKEKINFVLNNTTKKFMKDFDEKASLLPQNNEKTVPKVAYIPATKHGEIITKKTDFSIFEKNEVFI